MKKQIYKLIIIFLMLICFIFSFISMSHNKEVNKIKTKEKVVMLTFDDGPSASADEQILDILKQYNIKATFFMTGINLEKYETEPGVKRVVDRMVNEGHTLGNHSYYHSEYINDQKQLVKELNDVNDMIIKAYAENGKIVESKDIPIRMPYLQYYRGLGYVQSKVKNPFWVRGYLGTDFLEEKTGKNEIIKQYMDNLKKGQIFVAHTRDYAKEWLPEFIETLQEKGYKFSNFTKNSESYWSNYGKLGF
ncbi:polysaccharide deacetylase family protein [Mesoplasma florum]|uniref:polysaccharide deacetylase family protein n=1 Tax=Mesoplasma florum TaxID=2151 RepID=UPI000D09668C|nr:polysaccharide deacetylase family protein [Mesoplasma florum]AVN61221.1 chitin deacetylase [Mesoplasma florum]